jgi:hypothetical protein
MGQQMKVLAAEPSVPTQIAIPIGAVPGGGAEEQTGQRAALLIADQVLEIFSHGAAVAQIVVAVEESLKERSLTRPSRGADFGDDQRQQRGQRLTDRRRSRRRVPLGHLFVPHSIATASGDATAR